MATLAAKLEARAGATPNTVFFSEVIPLTLTALYYLGFRGRSRGSIAQVLKGATASVYLERSLKPEQSLGSTGHIAKGLRH
jgi:hypothetical protein